MTMIGDIRPETDPQPPGYTIAEAVRDSQQRAEGLLKLYELHPNAYETRLPDGSVVWCSPSVKPQHFLLTCRKERAVRMCPYERVGNVRVFTLPGTWFDADMTIERFRIHRPEAFGLLLETIGA